MTLGLGCTLAAAAAQQSASQSSNAGSLNPRSGEMGHDPNGVEIGRLQEQMADRRNAERQKQLIADTQKLFDLAQQLRDEVAKSNKDQLSIPVVKRSEEIEKLARSVKEKMRGY